MNLNEGQVLAGRVAVVTGSSRGLGLAFARLLGEHGATVVLTARPALDVERAVAELKNAGIAATV